MDFSQNEKKENNFLFKNIIFFTSGIFFGIFLIIFAIRLWIFENFFPIQKQNYNNSTNFSQFHNSVKNSEKNSKIDIFSSSEKIQKIYSILSENFYQFDQKTETELEEMFVKSLVSSLGDKYTEYLTLEENTEFQMELKWDFQGIGAVVWEHELWAKIQRILKDSPAEKFELKAWDIIIEVASKEVAWMDTTEIVKLIRWEKWTPVDIVFLRENEKIQKTIIRDSVHIPSVDFEKIWEKIGYIQINSFWEKTPEEFYEAIQELKKQNIEGFILDFRFNGWGYLESAQKMLGNFLWRNSKIVTVKTNNPTKDMSLFTSLLSNPDTQTPIVVLVNEFSASASEIVAGAIKEYNRGIIVGQKTYGKGSVQEMFPINDGSMVKITTSKWYTPNDKNIDAEWIEPDIYVEMQNEDYKNSFDRQKEEAQKILQELMDWKSQEEIIKNFKK